VNDSDLSHGFASLPAYQEEPVGTAATSGESLVTVRPSTETPAKLGTLPSEIRNPAVIPRAMLTVAEVAV
jgi:hypothetical protein